MNRKMCDMPSCHRYGLMFLGYQDISQACESRLSDLWWAFFLTTHTHHDKEHRSCSEAHEIRCSKKILFVGGCSERERLQITNKRNRNRVKSKRRRWVTQGDEMCDYMFSIMCMQTHIYVHTICLQWFRGEHLPGGRWGKPLLLVVFFFFKLPDYYATC